MSDKERKKDGKDTGKKRQRMREAVAARHESAGADRPTHDEGDTVPFKRGSAGDRTQSPATKHGAK